MIHFYTFVICHSLLLSLLKEEINPSNKLNFYAYKLSYFRQSQTPRVLLGLLGLGTVCTFMLEGSVS